MVIQRAEQLKALADPLRLRIVQLLHERGETCVCELVGELGTTQGNISSHLRALRTSGLVASQKIGKWVFYRLEPVAAADLLAWLTATLSPDTALAHPPADALYQVCCGTDVPLSRDQAQARVAVHGGGKDPSDG